MIVPSLRDLRAFIESFHEAFDQRACFVHVLPPPFYHNALFLQFTLPAIIQCMHASHFCQKPQLTSPGSKQFYLSQIFSVPLNHALKNVSMPSHHSYLEQFCQHRKRTYLPIVRNPHHVCYTTTRCFLFCPVTISWIVF